MDASQCVSHSESCAAWRKIVLVGNPNVGKSIFFGAWSGTYAEVSNFPGTTVEITRSRLGVDELFDTPGVYGVSSFNDEERVARDVIVDADVVVNVVDATHLERDLFLTLQIIDMGLPCVVAMNFWDEAQDRGIEVNLSALETELGVPVIATSAVRRHGLDDVLRSVEVARVGKQDPHVQEVLAHVQSVSLKQPDALLLAEGDVSVAERLGVRPLQERERLYLMRRRRVDALVGTVVTRPETGRLFRDWLGRACLEPLTALPILLGVLWGCYQLVGVLVAGDVVGFTEGTVMQGLYEPWVRSMIHPLVNNDSFWGRILVGEFGLFTMTVTYLLGLLLPLVVGFYAALSILEDSGYLPRLATVMDRLMNGIGLNGRAVIPVILGFGCVQLGTITTRILGSQREKTITTSILNFVVPCSAQLGVIVGMLATAGPRFTLVYALVIFSCLVVIGTVLNRYLPGESTPLLIDLPPMRLPRMSNVMRKVALRSWAFMKEAYLWFIAGALGISLLEEMGALTVWQRLLTPLTVGWLKLPPEASTSFVMGMVRRDFGAAGLTELALTPGQTVVALVTITLFVPCIASLMILFKERGFREGIMVWCGSWVLAFSVGGLLAQVML